MEKILNLKNGKISVCNKDGYKLYIYGDIVSSSWEKWSDEDTCPQDIADLLAKIPSNEPLDIYINSGGGDVHAGIAIYSQLSRRTGKNTVHVDGIAASIASVIAMAGDEIIMPKSAQLMVHKPWCCCMGNADEMRKTADILDTCQHSIMSIYQSKLADGVELDEFSEMVNAETWLTGEQAASVFKISLSDTPSMAASASQFYAQYRNKMKAIENNDEIEKLKIELELITI